MAIEQLPGIVSFFEKDVPAAFTSVRDPSLQHRFQQVNQAAVAALKSYENFLKTDLLNRSRGEFAIGAENYRKKLLYEEMVDIPLDRLLQIGFDNLRENQHKLVEVAHRIDPRKTPQQIAEELENDHPAPDHLLHR